MTNNQDKDMRTLDIVTHEVGLLEMQDGRSSPEDRRWAPEFITALANGSDLAWLQSGGRIG